MVKGECAVSRKSCLAPNADSNARSEVPYYEEEEPQEEYEPEPPEDGEELPIGDDEAENVIVSGDPAAAAKENAKSHKDKKIPNDQRITTPYMTKYEKARILGTRALQIRYGRLDPGLWHYNALRSPDKKTWLTLGTA